MTVAELIEKLKELPPQFVVWLDSRYPFDDGDGIGRLKTVESIPEEREVWLNGD